MSSQGERTEKPTSRRRQKARRQGQVPRSRELASAAAFAAAVLFFGFYAPQALDAMKNLIPFLWRRFLLAELTPAVVREMSFEVGWAFIVLVGPVVGLVALASVAGTVSFGGLVLSAEPLKLKVERLNPAENFKKIFSRNGIVNLIKAVALSAVIIYIFIQVIRDRLPALQTMAAMDMRSLLAASGDLVYTATFRVAVFLGVVAVFDVLFQRYSYEESLKMTKQEVKEDVKDTEGNPQIKARIRRMQYQMARNRMMAAVKDADVVVTNPTHFAVALKYDLAAMAAPQVVAKGQDRLALRIRELAAEHRVPLVENPELARALYKTVEVGGEVPVELYRAVAQILAYVYKLRKTQYR